VIETEPDTLNVRNDLILLAQKGLVVLLLVVIGIGLLALLSSAAEAVDVWFQRRWVPVVQFVGAGTVVGVALYALKLLLQRR
jgi:hypothetical protein